MGRFLPACVLVVVSVAGTHWGYAQEWTRFRGPNGSGVGRGPKIPAEITEQDARWNVELPGSGHSSPVLWGDKLFLTSAYDDKEKREAICIDARSGTVLWSWRTDFVPYRHNRDNNFAASTPAVDDARVYLTWVSGGRFLALCLSHQGKLLWRRDLGTFAATHGAGTSCTVTKGIVLVANDNRSDGSLIAGLDAETGRTRWQVDRESGGTSYTTPPLYRPAGGPRQAIFVSNANGVSGINTETGDTVWELPGVFTLKSVASPVLIGNIVFISAGKGGGGIESVAIRLGETPKVLYQLTEGLPYVPTPIAVNGLLFVLSDRGSLMCVEPGTGKVLWQTRLEARFYSSPVAVNGRIYCLGRKGELIVVAAERELRLLSKTQLPEGSHATPAIANGRLYIRTYSRLMSIGDPGE